MRKVNLIYIVLFLFFLQGCYDDDSTGIIREVVLPELMTDAKDSVNLYLGENLKIKSEVKDAETGLSYEWGIGLYSVDKQTGKILTTFEKISGDKDLDYRPRDLGHYYLRQVVGNGRGNTIRYYHVFVNSEFEEGYLILGKKEDGNGSLAFMKTLTPEEIGRGEQPVFRQNLFAYINEGEKLGQTPVDCRKVWDKLFILCRDARKLYQLDAKSFQLQYTFDYTTYSPDFDPLNLMSFDGQWCEELYSTSANGGIVKIYYPGLDIFPFSGIDQNLTFDYVCCRKNTRYSNKTSICLINRKERIAYAEGYDRNNPPTYWTYIPCYDFFKGREIIQAFFDADCNLVFYNKQGQVYKKTKIGRFITNLYTYELDLIYDTECTTNSEILTQETQLIPNDLMTCAFFFKSNEVYKWYYNQSDLPTEPFIVLPEGEVITTINQTDDHRQLLIGSYNPDRPDLKGSLYVYDTDTGDRIGDPHEGVADYPVTVMYKTK